jgi:hypothetical protein
MAVVTITYANGTVRKAIVLSHEDQELRVVAAGSDEVLCFNCIHGNWISEDAEPVTIEFAWQRRGASYVPSEDECICPKELAARLLQTLLGGGARDEAGSDTSCAFGPDGTPAAVHPVKPRLN